MTGSSLDVGHPKYTPETTTESVAVPFLRLLLRFRWFIVGCAFVASLGTGLFVFLSKPTYTADASFIPLTRGGGGIPSNLAGLASQFGVNLPTSGDASLPPAYWADLVHNRTLLHGLLGKRLPTVARDSIQVSELLKVSEPDSTRRERETLRRLERAIRAAPVVRSGTIQLTVVTHDPVASAALARRVLESIIAVSVQRRQKTAEADYDFFAREQDSAFAQVDRADAAVLAFRESNKAIMSSPRLSLELDQLQRRAQAKLTLATGLAQAAVQARLEADRSTPTISVIEEPSVPFDRNPRGTLSKGLLAGIVGGVLGVLVVLGRVVARRVGETLGGYEAGQPAPEAGRL